MKNSKFYILAPVMLLIMSFSVATHSWYLLDATEHGFKVQFPGKPTVESKKINSAVGKLKMNMYLYQPTAGDKNLMYLFNYTEYPADKIHSDQTDILDGFFRNAIDGAVKAVDGKLLSEKTISIGKYPGREVKVDYKDGYAIITMRMYLVKNKMFLLESIAEAKNEPNESTAKFMDSLVLAGDSK